MTEGRIFFFYPYADPSKEEGLGGLPLAVILATSPERIAQIDGGILGEEIVDNFYPAPARAWALIYPADLFRAPRDGEARERALDSGDLVFNTNIPQRDGDQLLVLRAGNEHLICALLEVPLTDLMGEEA